MNDFVNGPIYLLFGGGEASGCSGLWMDEVIWIVYFLELYFYVGEIDVNVWMVFYVAVPFFTMDMQQLQMTEYVELK